MYTPDIGIVGFGRGGAYVTRASDLMGGMYYNPAGLYQLDGFNLEGGLLLLRTNRWFERTGGDGGEDGGGIYNVDSSGGIVEGSLDETFPRTEMDPYFRPIPEVGIAFGFDKPDLTLAFGLYAPFAPIQVFPEYGPGRYRLIDQELIQGNFVLSAGWKPLPFLAVGASVQLLVMQLNQSFKASADFLSSGEASNPEDPQWDVVASFSADAYSPYFTVGALLMPAPFLRIGVSFNPPYRFEGKGTAGLNGVLGQRYFAELPQALADLYGREAIHVVGQDEEVHLSTGLPGALRVAVGVEPILGVLDLELGFHVEIWHESGDVVASEVDVGLTEDNPDDGVDAVPLAQYLDDRGLCAIIEARDLPCDALGSYTGDGGTVTVPADYGTTWSLRFGGELRPLPFFGIRFGYLFEPPAIPDATLALTMLDSSKHLVSGGLSLRLGATRERSSLVDLHLSYAHVFYEDRTVALDDSRALGLALEGVPHNKVDAGSYGGEAHLFGLNVGFHFSDIVRGAKAGAATRSNSGKP